MTTQLPLVQALEGQQERRAGGHNWPDLEIVLDPTQTEIVDDQIYLVQIPQREPVVKRLRKYGETQAYLHPALASIHDQKTVELFGQRMPCQTVEFSDNIYLRYLTIHGRVVGLWAGKA